VKKQNITNPPTSQESFGIKIAVPYGSLTMSGTDLIDHASMRVEQLDALLILIVADESSSFGGLRRCDQNNLFWMMQQMADEIREIMPHLVVKKAEVTA
jgi:hypothetical protein